MKMNNIHIIARDKGQWSFSGQKTIVAGSTEKKDTHIRKLVDKYGTTIRALVAQPKRNSSYKHCNLYKTETL